MYSTLSEKAMQIPLRNLGFALRMKKDSPRNRCGNCVVVDDDQVSIEGKGLHVITELFAHFGRGAARSFGLYRVSIHIKEDQCMGPQE